MENQGSAQTPTQTIAPLDSETVVFRPPKLLCLIGILDMVILIVCTWGLMTESSCCDPEVPRSLARCLPFLIFTGTFIGLFALGTIYLYRYRLILSPESITVRGLWRPTVIRADQITRLQWISIGMVVVHSENAKFTISVMNSTQKHQIHSLLNKYYADKPQDGLEDAIAREERVNAPISISIPLTFIGLFIAGVIAAYIAYQITVALIMAILSVIWMLWLIWFERRKRRKTEDRSKQQRVED